MPATREPVTKRAQMAVPLAVHTTSVSHVDSHFEACIRADLSFSLLSAGLRYEPPPPLFYPSNNSWLPAESVKSKLYSFYARGIVAAIIIAMNLYSWNSR
jgi:hypothetical protein